MLCRVVLCNLSSTDAEHDQLLSKLASFFGHEGLNGADRFNQGDDYSSTQEIHLAVTPSARRRTPSNTNDAVVPKLFLLAPLCFTTKMFAPPPRVHRHKHTLQPHAHVLLHCGLFLTSNI